MLTPRHLHTKEANPHLDRNKVNVNKEAGVNSSYLGLFSLWKRVVTYLLSISRPVPRSSVTLQKGVLLKVTQKMTGRK